MTVFCDQTGVRLIAPNGLANEAADAKAYRAKTRKLRPVSVKVDPENGWEEVPPTKQAEPKPEPKPEPKAAPEAERNNKPAAPAAYVPARRGNK